MKLAIGYFTASDTTDSLTRINGFHDLTSQTPFWQNVVTRWTQVIMLPAFAKPSQLCSMPDA